MPGSQLPSNDEELDAAMALAALVGGGVPERGSLWREDSGQGASLGRRGSDAEQRLDGISWTLRRRRSGSVIVVNEKGSPMTELSSKLAKMQEWEDRQRVGNKGGSSVEFSQSGLSDAGGSDISRAGDEGEEPKGPSEARVSSLIPGVAQAKVEQAFERGLEGIAALLKDERPPLIRAPSFPPQLSVNTLLPQLSMASQSSLGGCLPRESLGGGLQSQHSLGLQSQRSIGGELQSQLSAPSAFLAAIAASLPPSASQPWPAFPTLANPLSNPVSNPITRAQSITEFQFEDRVPPRSGLELPSPKLVDFLSPANQFSERDGLQDRDSELGGLKEELLEGGEKEEEPGLGFGGGSRKRLARSRRRKAALVGIEDPDPAKEAQRLRRIQANRESARKTIMRKQAVCKKLATEAQDLGDENLDLRSKVEAAQRELHRLITEQAKLKEELLAAQREAEEPLDALPSTSAPLLPDLSDDRKSNDGLPKPGDGVFEPALGLEKPPPDLETAPEQEALGLALDEVARSVSKEGLAKLGEGCGNPGLTTPRCDEEGPGDRNVDELQTGQVRSTEGEEKGSGDAVISNPSAARSGEGSSMEPSSGNPLATSETGKAFGMEKSPPLEPLSKRGSNESVTAEAKQPPGKASSGSAFLRALAGGLSFAQPSSLSKPPKTETAERPAQSGLLGKTAPETGGSSNKGAEKGGAEAGLDMSAPVPSSGTPSGYLPDVSMSFGGVQSEQVPRGGVSLQAEGRSSVHSTGGRGSGPDLEAFPAGGEVGRKTSASPPLPLSLSLLHTIATEFCSDPPSAEFGANRDHVKMDQGKGDVSKRAGGDNASGIDHRGVNKGRDDGGVKMDAMMRGGVNGDGVPWGGVNGDGLQQLGTSRSLPLNPWLSLRPQSLQRNLSAPMQTSVPPQQSGLEFFNLGTGLSAPKQANPVQNQTANPGPHLSQNPSLNALPKGSPFAKDGLNQDPFNPRSTSRQTSSGDDLSFGPIWRQEGLLNANPALDAVSRKPRPFGGAPGQTFVPLQNGGSQNLLGSHGLPNTLWGDSANRGPVPPSMPWLPERNLSGAYPNQGLDVSLSLQPSAPPRTVKPETGMYNVYRGSGRRGSVSLHIGPLPVVDAVTAAEARKRRREVTKSKFGPSGGPSAKVQKVAGAKAAR